MTRSAALLAVVCLVLVGCAPESSVRTDSGDGLASPSAPPCPPADAEGDAIIDYVAFVKVGERMYAAAGASGPVLVDPDLIGRQVGEVRCRIADTVGDPDFRPRSGDAAFLPVGTKLHAFGEADPTLRLAVQEDGEWRVYESSDVEGAQRGDDVLDISPETVTRVELRDGDTATTVIGEITAAAEVADLTRAVLDAPVVQPDWDSMDEGPVFVRFELRDGTFVERPWHVDSGYLASRLEAPKELKLLLDKG